ncbi:ataxin-7-like protein 2b isoform X2 [Cheilinus undulatus]|uniref:ataxin-7-like protein 2b isoform X2 n=1 Tax=Cheilinus undulatus TaxID=241271 RepID=UPI001BD47CA1|nr:ataxin-7-like protein 2b isoform X2 [Cheilinus undulatus]
MAAVDRRNPNLDDFVGLNWSCWVDGVNILPSDADSNAEGSSKYWSTRCESMTLMKEDMHIYGHCPAHDEVYLVVCSYCGQVVKPQAFEKHCERRHGPLPKICSPSPAVASQWQPCPSSNLHISREKQKDGRIQGDSTTSSAGLPAHKHRLTKDTVSFSSMEKLPQETPPPHSLKSSSTLPHPRVPPWHSGPLPHGHCSSSTSVPERPIAQKPTAEKECDLNKHSRALDPKRKKLCSRELICNTDSIQQQQKALGKTKTFDQLEAEPKTGSAGRNIEQLPVKTKEKTQHSEAFEDNIKTQSNKCNLKSSCHILRSRDTSVSFAEEDGDSTVEVEVQPPYPFNQTLLSSDEDEDEDEQEEAEDLPATPLHPKPLGLCTFGCRTFGCSIFTFDRRWHHLRFALSAMFEHHVGTHLWKKMAQVPKGLRSHHNTPQISGSPIRTGARLPKSFHTLNLDSTSFGQQEAKLSQSYAHSKKQPSSNSPASLSPGRPCSNAVRRPNRSQLKEAELLHDANSEDKSFIHIRDPLFHEKGQPHAPSSDGPLNRSFPFRQNLCPPQQTVMESGRTGHAQKRKSRNESMPLSSSATTTSKYKRLSPPSCSKLLAWK